MSYYLSDWLRMSKCPGCGKEFSSRGEKVRHYLIFTSTRLIVYTSLSLAFAAVFAAAYYVYANFWLEFGGWK